MNKKVSTILTLGLFLGGSLLNVANAEQLKDFFGKAPEKVDGSQYFIKVGTGATAQYLHSTVDAVAKAVSYDLVAETATIEKEDVKEYLWTLVSAPQANGAMGFQFKNVKSGEIIRVNVAGGTLIETTKTDDADYKAASYVFYFGGTSATDAQDMTAGYVADQNVGVAEKNIYLDDATTPAFDISAASTNANVFNLVKLGDGINVEVSDLNELYNSTGFNFDLNDDKLSGVANIFAEKKVVALKVDGSALIPGTTNVYGIRNGSTDEYFPNGTYFATYAPVNDNENPSFAELLNCTFIAVDADANISGDEDEQKAGLGFTLTEVNGKDLVVEFDKDGNKSAGNQNSVYNACFTVQESTTDDVYSLSLGHVRFVEKAGENAHKEAALGISASKSSSAIATAASASFIFKFAESTLAKPISLLNEDGAAIYNIQFYQKNGNDESVNGKYLTYDLQKGEYIAKGKVLADLNTPAYQWVISKVNDNNNVVFTNRETGKTFTTQLFEEGEDLYSLAPETITEEFSYYNINSKGDVVEYETATDTDRDGDKTDIRFKGKYVKLLPVADVDNYAGYLNVDDETVMTLSFGRDIAPTSNKLYPIVEKATSGSTEYEFANELTGEVADAAQWRLHKSVNPVAKKYNYLYANGDLINTKTQGDIVYAYTYTLELVVDGIARGEYLNMGSASSSIETEANATKFYIQENVDGSVLLKTSRTAASAMFLTDEDSSGDLIMDMDELAKEDFYAQSIEAASLADEVKTYLIAEAPAISLPANEGHYSIVSERGNYITMNEERDGLTVKEESEPLYLYVTDTKAVVPSFYITKSAGQNTAERMFLFNPTDSVNYYVADGAYDKVYQLPGKQVKAIFKAATISESRDTLTTSIKGESTLVAMDANNTEKVEGGLDKFKMQIIESADADDMYVIRQLGGGWLTAVNGMLVWGNKVDAMNFNITGAAAPTANEGVSATEVKIIATDGAVNVKNAAGKNVVISTILGQIVANEVLTSDNATISVPAGIAIVSVDGEEAVKVSVR